MTNTSNSTPKNILTAFGHWNILGMSATTSIALALTFLTLVMWFLNISGSMGVNLFLFFGGAIFIIVMATSLAAVMAAGVIGAFGAFFDDKDISQGAITGLSTLGKLIWGLLLGWFLIAGLLSTWSFAYNPAAFFFVAAGALTAMVALQFYKISTGKWLIIGVLTYCAIVVLLALGSTSPNMVKIGQTAKRTGDQFTNYVTSGDSTIPAQPVSPEEQARREKIAKQDGNLLAIQRAADAEANAKAAEAARLTTSQTSNLPADIMVPHCNNGWSDPVVLPVDWAVTAGWGGKHTKVQYLNNGEWKTAQYVKITESVEAFRYCSTSRANLALGNMSLTWRSF